MGLQPGDTLLPTLDQEDTVESTLDGEVIRCLDAVTALLGMQRSANNLLREGWLEIAKARYTLGPSRISYALFSLRPCSASTRVDLSCLPVDSKDHIKTADFDDQGALSPGDVIGFNVKLLRGVVEEQERVSVEDGFKPAAVSQLRRRVNLQGLQGDATTEKLLDALMLSDDSESDAETQTDPVPSKANRHQQDPLLMFGALVPPHLRSAQSLFTKALELMVKIAETQSTIQLSCDKVMKLKQKLHLRTHDELENS